MRVAVPTFATEVSPRFCFAREVLIVDLDGEAAGARSTLVLGGTCNPDRLRALGARGVKLLACGGFDREFLAEAQAAGVHVVWGLTGSVDSVLERAASGELATAAAHRECWCRGEGLGGTASSKHTAPSHRGPGRRGPRRSA